MTEEQTELNEDMLWVVQKESPLEMDVFSTAQIWASFILADEQNIPLCTQLARFFSLVLYHKFNIDVFPIRSHQFKKLVIAEFV